MLGTEVEESPVVEILGTQEIRDGQAV